MNTEPTWKKIASKTIYQNKWMQINEDEVIDPAGKKTTYTFVAKDPGILLIPIFGDCTFLVTQYRYPIQKNILQFPLESMEPNEDIETAVKRAVKEELGMKLVKTINLGKAYVDPGLKTQLMHVYLTYVSEDKDASGQLEDSEADLKIQKIKISELDKYVKSGKICDYATLTGLYYLNLNLNLNQN